MPKHHHLKAETGVFILTPSNSNTTTTSSTITTTLSPVSEVSSLSTDKSIENAVYSHIRALRSLGETQVNTLEIAQALKINPARVAEVIRNLESKGVKIAS